MSSAGKKVIYKCVALLPILIQSQLTFASTILINNTLSQEEEGSLLEVDSITTHEGVKSRYNLKIYPGETKELSSSDLLGFQVSRIFGTHKLRYEVTCKGQRGSEPIKFNITNIHEDKLGSDCKLTGYGHWSKRTGFNWIVKKKSILDRYKKKR